MNPYCKKALSGGSYKLEAIDWLSGFFYTDNQSIPVFVEVRFKNTRKLICRNPEKLNIHPGDMVVLETPTGNDVGMVILTSRLVNYQMKKKEISPSSDTVGTVIRHAGIRDLQILREARALEADALIESRKIARELKLEMKVNDVEFQGDKKKATFYYTAEGRVDFRELIKVFAKTFRVKIEMRQIGIRQEAGRVGGLGDCGREICCSTWLTDFTTVPTVAAKQQNLYLNPSKLSGQCSRLKCCLNYELDIYLEALEGFPDENIVLKTEKESFKVIKIDILRKVMWFINTNDKDSHFYPILVSNIRKILEMNSNKKFPPDLTPYVEKDRIILNEEIEEEYQNFLASQQIISMIKQTKVFLYFLITMALIIASACRDSHVYEKYEKIKSPLWNENDPLTFNINITDTAALYNVFLNIRNSGKYQYSNIWLIINKSDPAGNHIFNKRFEFVLASQEGKWLGNGLGDIFDSHFSLEEKVKFTQKGIFRYVIYQNMRVADLPGISDMGIEIEKVSKSNQGK